MTLEEQIDETLEQISICVFNGDDDSELVYYQAILASLKELQELREREEDYKSMDINNGNDTGR